MKHLIKLRKDFVIKKTPKAYLVKLPINGNTQVSINNHVWLPKSQIMVDEKKEEDMIFFYLPAWLIDRIGLYEFLENPDYFDYEKSLNERFRSKHRDRYDVYGDIDMAISDDINNGIWNYSGDDMGSDCGSWGCGDDAGYW